MSRIHAKQVIGAVNDSTAQNIGGDKNFIGKTSFASAEGQHVVIHGGFFYWVANKDNLNQSGNTRQGMINGQLTTQSYDGENWV